MKKVYVNALCPLCNNNPENIMHILVTCTFAQLCWRSIGVNCEADIQIPFL